MRTKKSETSVLISPGPAGGSKAGRYTSYNRQKIEASIFKLKQMCRCFCSIKITTLVKQDQSGILQEGKMTSDKGMIYSQSLCGRS